MKKKSGIKKKHTWYLIIPTCIVLLITLMLDITLIVMSGTMDRAFPG